MDESSVLFERLGGRPTLEKLLRHFYADVRQHELIGPIFNSKIEDWPAHIEKIAKFWSQVTGGPAQYAGGMPMKHIPLGLREEHFKAWLGLWEINCRQWLPPEPASELIAQAHQIAIRLRQFCGVPLPASPYANNSWISSQFKAAANSSSPPIVD
jgi:hemoglobin